MNISRHLFFVILSLAISSSASKAQEHGADHADKMEMKSHRAQSHDQLKGMNGGMADRMEAMHPKTFIQEVKHHATSGTSAEPNSIPAPMLMTMKGNWMLMFHGNAFVLGTQQSSPRGGDKFFSTNWLMSMAQRSLGPGQLTLRAMFSLEPATVTGRRYPLLFQQGRRRMKCLSPMDSIHMISSWNWPPFTICQQQVSPEINTSALPLRS